MLDYCLWQWLKEEPTMGYFGVTLAGAAVLALPADPMRFSFSIPNGFNGNLMLKLTDQPSQPTQFVIQATEGLNVFTWEQFGGAVQLPLYASTTGAGTTLGFITMSWNAKRYSVYRRIMDDYLSKFGAS